MTGLLLVDAVAVRADVVVSFGFCSARADLIFLDLLLWGWVLTTTLATVHTSYHVGTSRTTTGRVVSKTTAKPVTPGRFATPEVFPSRNATRLQVWHWFWGPARAPSPLALTALRFVKNLRLCLTIGSKTTFSFEAGFAP